MSADYTLAQPGAVRELTGPDLAALPTLNEQLAILDAARDAGDVEQYVDAWLLISDANGGGMSALWWNDDAAEAEAELMSGHACDSQFDQRRERWQALHDHHATVDNFRAGLERELLRRRRFSDNRRAPIVEVKAVVRAFLATGGSLLLPPVESRRRNGTVEVSFETRSFLSDEWTDAQMCAANAIVRMLRRWRAQPTIERIVRALGVPKNGWFVLEARR